MEKRKPSFGDKEMKIQNGQQTSNESEGPHKPKRNRTSKHNKLAKRNGNLNTILNSSKFYLLK